MHDEKEQSGGQRGASELTELFARTRDAFRGANLILAEGTSRGRYAADQWFSGRRTPPPEVLAQVARNLRRRANMLHDLAAEFDACAAGAAPGEASTRTSGAAQKQTATPEVGSVGRCEDEPAGAPGTETIWPRIRDLNDAHVYIASLAGAPVPGVGRPFGALSRQEQEDLVLRMVQAGE